MAQALRVDVKSNLQLDVVARRITPAMARVIKGGVVKIERDGKSSAPVNLGRLRSAIHHQVEEKPGMVTGRVYVKAATKYAAWVEYGTGQIGKRTALAQGVEAPSWYEYGSKSGHYVPLATAPELRLWLKRKAGYDLEAIGGGRYDIMIKGTNTLVRRAAKYWHVTGAAQPYLTPAFMRHQPIILRDMGAVVADAVKQ